MSFNPEKIRLRQFNAAEGYLLLEMPDHALRELHGIDDLCDDVYGISMLRGEALRIKKDYHQALDAFSLAHHKKPTDRFALMGMAWCYKRINELPKAIDAMKLAYQFNQEVATVLYNLACYYALAGDKDNALSWLGRALRMDRKLLKGIATESDFDSLRSDPDFQHLLELTGTAG